MAGFAWNEQMIRFLRDAAEQVGFYQRLVAEIAPLLGPSARVCDVGCGLGYLSLALAPFCQEVVAVDSSGPALAVLRENLLAGRPENVRVYEGDAWALPPELRFDTMVFCFFGSLAETLHLVKAHCDGRAILFKKDWQSHRFSLEQRPLERFTYPHTLDKLAAWHIPYRSRVFPLEMGQPLRSLAAAAEFFRLYDRSGNPPQLSEEELLAQLTLTGDPAFPYYRPAPGQIGMIVLEAGAIPDSINESYE